MTDGKTDREETLSRKDIYRNVFTMDDENIEKFKKLYGVGWKNDTDEFLEAFFSFSKIIPEPIKDESDKNWIDNSGQNLSSFLRHVDCGEGEIPGSVVGRDLEIWRYDNWGTSSEVLYDSIDFPFLSFGWFANADTLSHALDDLLKGKYSFYTLCKPPIKIYEKMASDGLIFEVTWTSAFNEN